MTLPSAPLSSLLFVTVSATLSASKKQNFLLPPFKNFAPFAAFTSVNSEPWTQKGLEVGS